MHQLGLAYDPAMTELDYSLAAVRKELADLEQRRGQLLRLRARLAHRARGQGVPARRIAQLLGATRARASLLARLGR